MGGKITQTHKHTLTKSKKKKPMEGEEALRFQGSAVLRKQSSASPIDPGNNAAQSLTTPLPCSDKWIKHRSVRTFVRPESKRFRKTDISRWFCICVQTRARAVAVGFVCVVCASSLPRPASAWEAKAATRCPASSESHVNGAGQYGAYGGRPFGDKR